MHGLPTVLVAALLAACTPRKSTTLHSSPDRMETIRLQMSAQAEQVVRLPSRGSSGLQLLCTVDDPTLVQVTPQAIGPEERRALHLRPGDPVPALFLVRGQRPGTTTIHFVERPVGRQNVPDLPLKDYRVQVDP
ncbi:MAG: hypothetical protein ICV83_21355 [Cytophagales bacterium]|nr:hypothetical protein [Cytophagales bacterium]